MIDIDHFRLHVVRATLTYMRMWSAAAEELLLGTAAQESGLVYLRQFDAGPARGVYQIEPATHDDIVGRYLRTRTKSREKVLGLQAPYPPLVDQLMTNLAYATAIARLVYWRHPEPLPAPDDVEGLGRYYKKYFNTALGKGSAEEFAANYRRHVLGRADVETSISTTAPTSYEFRVMIRPVSTIKKLLKLHGQPENKDAFTYLDQRPRIIVMPSFPGLAGTYARWWMDLFRHEHRHVIEGKFHERE